MVLAEHTWVKGVKVGKFSWWTNLMPSSDLFIHICFSVETKSLEFLKKKKIEKAIFPNFSFLPVCDAWN